ncbi:zymogen granule membrane protein 16-like [Terrapene carolina triunguis]|uniref:zymogen granule membrane protein 16-like n=1 Tax=Terrapene triunguis TaxID=2587831 RepID=UPI0011562F1E|nr:zymogen granule membrane protein 16-like [Terrapene carolina triunguis]
MRSLRTAPRHHGAAGQRKNRRKIGPNTGRCLFASGRSRKNSGFWVSTTGQGRLQQRMWIQVRYGNAWSSVNGAAWGTLVQMDLEPCESIVQVQGSYSYWVVTSLTFTTSLGRTFLFGNQSGGTFLALPPAPGSVLRAVSGRAGSYLYAIGFHWGAPPAKGAPCSA